MVTVTVAVPETVPAAAASRAKVVIKGPTWAIAGKDRRYSLLLTGICSS